MNPHTEAERLMRLSHQYTALSEEAKGLIRIKAGVYRIMLGTAKSIAAADREWSVSDEGIREDEIKLEMASIASDMSAIKTFLRQQEMEARNQF